MKIAIVYATKTGTTAQAAGQLADALMSRGFEIALYDLARTRPDLAAADAVALGGSVRMGQWRRRAKRFARAHEAELLQKPLALFLCRMDTDDPRVLLKAQAGEKLTEHAVYAGCLGGMMDLEKLKGFDRFIMKMVQKSEESKGMTAAPGISQEGVNACADALQGALSP